MPKNTRTLRDISRALFSGPYEMISKPIKTPEFRYPMIKFLINLIRFIQRLKVNSP